LCWATAVAGSYSRDAWSVSVRALCWIRSGDPYRTETAYTLQSLLWRSVSNGALLPVGRAMPAWEVST